MKNKSVYITNTNCITPLGFDVDSNFEALLLHKSGIQKHKKIGNIENFYSAIIDEVALNDKFQSLSKELNFTKLEKMMILALEPMIKQNNVGSKTAFIFSTTKGNIDFLADLDNSISEAQLNTLAKKISTYFGFQTEPIVVSNACVSGVLAVAVAKRMIQTELYDDAYIVAGDIVSEFVLSGFNSFQAMSDEPCQPYDVNRKGVNLGEATAAVYITTVENKTSDICFKIVGDGAINDANHISGPSRTGEGLFKSIKSALKESKLEPKDIDFISAHGTATLFNDEMEAIAFNRLDLQNTPVNSLKGYYGHTLGASGLLETVIALESAKRNQLLVSEGYEKSGVTQQINIIKESKSREIKNILKTASGFGGCNTAVLFEKMN
jgi:3-oxoacyl-[acyl-carrier-protein] synthase I